MTNVNFESKPITTIYSGKKRDELTSRDVDQSLIEQDFKIYELENMVEQLRKQLKIAEFQNQDLNFSLKRTQEEKNNLEIQLNEILQKRTSNDDNSLFINTNETLGKENFYDNEIKEENKQLKTEINILKNYICELEKEKELFLKNEEELKNEKNTIQNNLEILLEKTRIENDNLDNEKRKIQEELDTLYQTYNYESEELKNLTEINKNLEKKVNFVDFIRL